MGEEKTHETPDGGTETTNTSHSESGNEAGVTKTAPADWPGLLFYARS